MPRITGKLLRTFKRTSKHRQGESHLLSRRERLILLFSTVQFAIATWFIAGVHLSTQWVLLAAATVNFLMLFLPVEFGEAFRVVSVSGRENLRRLFRFPVFWFGLVWILYIVVQDLNHAWTFQRDVEGWWMARDPFLSWLPSGVQAPLDVSSAWRLLLRSVPAWLLLCTLWVGLRRRSAVRALLWIVAVNLFLWALVAVFQYIMKPQFMLWFYNTGIGGLYYLNKTTGQMMQNCKYFGTMINPNHAAAMLNLGAVAASALGFYYFDRTLKTMARSGPHLILFIMGAVMLGCVFLAVSRMAIIIALGIILTLVVLFLIKLWRERAVLTGGLVPGILITLMGVACLTVVVMVYRPHEVKGKMDDTREIINNPQQNIRYVLNKAGLQMFEKHWLTGWGAGGFRYFYPIYMKRVPGFPKSFYKSIYDPITATTDHVEVPLFFPFLHNDYLESLIEYGVLGCLPILAFIGWIVWKLWQRRVLLGIPILCLVLGIALVCTHGLTDFIFTIPAVTTTLACLIAATVLHLETEHERVLQMILEQARRG
ncbi:MAG: O-antigen ligase family protein [Verrucomicrobiota bacterium]|nr:O-antigen ligase family protein [Verrucomicrobiota bacterium]